MIVVTEIEIDVVLGIYFMRAHEVSLDLVHDKMVVDKKGLDLKCNGKQDCYSVKKRGHWPVSKKRQLANAAADLK